MGRGIGRLALYLLLGFAAGLPFTMFNAVLTLRLARNGVDIVLIGLFAWVAVLPTLKFAWAPLLDRFDIPGFSSSWGRRRGWIMLSTLGICLAMTGMGLTADDRSLPLTSLLATLLAFWTTTLEIAADGWRIELAPSQEEQASLVAAYLWGYRGAMVAAGSGAVLIAAQAEWSAAYFAMAIIALLPLPILCATRPEPGGASSRAKALITGLPAAALILTASLIVTAGLGSCLLRLAAAAGLTGMTNIMPAVLVLAAFPFLLLAAALPRIRRLGPDSPALRSAAFGSYVEIFRRYGYTALPLFAFIACYRMGDVMTLTLSHPLWNARGYSLRQIAMADGGIAVAAAMAGVASGSWIAHRSNLVAALAIGAMGSAFGNWIFVWLWMQPPNDLILYFSAGLDQFAHGMESAVFVVFLSMLVDPRHAGAQYAFLSGWALLLPRLVSGAAGAIQARLGYDGFFWLSGSLSAAAILFLPLLMRTGMTAESCKSEETNRHKLP